MRRLPVMDIFNKDMDLRSSHFTGALRKVMCDSDRLLRHSFIVFFFTHAASAANMLFQMVMGWNLSKAEFGVLSSMLALMMVIVMPMSAISNTLVHFTGNLIKEGKHENIRLLARQWTRRILFISIPLMILLVILHHPLASFFHLTTPWPLILAGATLFVSVLSPVFGGVLQGMQKFVLVGLPGLANGLIRLGLGGFLVLVIAPNAVSGLSAHAFAALCSTALAYLFYLKCLPPSAPDSKPLLESSDKYFWASLAALLSFSILMNMDVVLIKHYFKDQDTVGVYARASMIGKMIIFLVQPIAGAMFPKVVSRGNMASDHKFTFLKALVLTGLIIFGGALLCTIFPQIPLLILYRDHAPTPDMISLVRLVCWAMAPLGLVFLLMNLELAQHRLACVMPLALCAADFIGGVALFHASLRQVVFVLMTVNVTSLALLTILPFTRKECKSR